MAFTVSTSVQREFRTTASPESAYALLSDLPRSAGHFPKIERFEAVGDAVWSCGMERIAVAGQTLQQTTCACRYRFDPQLMEISWVPVEGIGNALLEGSWRIRPEGRGCRVRLVSSGTLIIQLPSILEPLLAPLVIMESSLLTERYLLNLQTTLGRS